MCKMKIQIGQHTKNTLCTEQAHHMGLDTHDYGILTEPMQANMVFTVEPGIYIPDEGFGIRLEDDVVIQENRRTF